MAGVANVAYTPTWIEKFVNVRRNAPDLGKMKAPPFFARGFFYSIRKTFTTKSPMSRCWVFETNCR